MSQSIEAKKPIALVDIAEAAEKANALREIAIPGVQACEVKKVVDGVLTAYGKQLDGFLNKYRDLTIPFLDSFVSSRGQIIEAAHNWDFFSCPWVGHPESAVRSEMQKMVSFLQVGATSKRILECLVRSASWDTERTQMILESHAAHVALHNQMEKIKNICAYMVLVEVHYSPESKAASFTQAEHYCKMVLGVNPSTIKMGKKDSKPKQADEGTEKVAVRKQASMKRRRVWPSSSRPSSSKTPRWTPPPHGPHSRSHSGIKQLNVEDVDQE